jgi:hypothetical protein
MYVPQAETPILSLLKLRQAGLDFDFTPNSNSNEFVLSARKTNFKLHGYAVDNICYVSEGPMTPQALAVTTRSANKRQIDEVEILETCQK